MEWFSRVSEYGGVKKKNIQIDSMLPWVCSVIDHRWRKNMVKTSVTHSPTAREPLLCFYHILTSSVIYNNGEFKMSLRRRNENMKKVIGSGKQNNNLHVHHAFLYNSWPSLHDYDMNWTISRFIDNVNVWRRIPLSLFKLEYLS